MSLSSGKACKLEAPAEPGLGVMVSGFGFWVSGFGFRVQVYGLGLQRNEARGELTDTSRARAGCAKTRNSPAALKHLPFRPARAAQRKLNLGNTAQTAERERTHGPALPLQIQRTHVTASTNLPQCCTRRPGQHPRWPGVALRSQR
jgi:hypothetical protein